MNMYPSWMGNTLDNLGAAAGTFPQPPVFNTIDRLGEARATAMRDVPPPMQGGGVPYLFGPGGPQAAPGAVPAGWQTAVGPSAAGVGYVDPVQVAQGAATNPAELVRQGDQRSPLARFLAGFDFTPAKVMPAAAPFAFARPIYGIQPLGQRRGR